MVIGHLILSLILSGASVALLVAGLRFRPRTPVWALFVILFLATWAGGVWVVPFGPTHLGVTWLPFLLIEIMLAVLVVVLSPRGHRARQEVEREVDVGIGLFLFVRIVGALMAAIVGGYRSPRTLRTISGSRAPSRSVPAA
jgi:hypothetical protein